MDAPESPQTRFFVRERLTDVRAWRLRLREVFEGWSRGLSPASADSLREGLGARLARLEQRIEETMNKAKGGKYSGRDREHLYRLLGACRDLSEAGLEYARTAEGIDWDRWRAARF